MKILIDNHTPHTDRSGIPRYWNNLATHLQKTKKLSVIEYTFTGNPIIDNGLYRLQRGFKSKIKAINPDIIHVSNFAPLNTTSIPVVTTVHDVCFNFFPSTFSLKSRLAFQFFFKKSLQTSSHIIAVSQTVKKNLTSYFSIDPNKISVIYEAADPVFKRQQAKKETQRVLRKYNISSPFFLVVGTLNNRKRPLEIIDSFSKANTPTQLIFIGRNDLKEKVIDHIRSVHMTHKIKILETVTDSELNCLYNVANSLLYYSYCEGFGLPLTEAMQCHTPIICSDIPVFREVAGQAAIYAKNTNELTRAINFICTNRGAQKKYSFLSGKRKKLFSWTRSTKETIDVYKKCLIS